MRDLRARFVARIAADRREIEALDARGSAGRLRELAHGLAGAGGTFGFPGISAAAERLEVALDAGAPAAEPRAALIAALRGVETAT